VTQITWAYGVTTYTSRRDNLLPKTLSSLANAGFGEPWLFVDGENHGNAYRERFGFNVTCHYPRIRAYPNFVLGLWELYLRFPDAMRYAMFQDDFVTYHNLREYLDRSMMPEKGYFNLLTFMENEGRIKGQPYGWTQASQRGRGAVGLVFPKEALRTLFCANHFVDRVQERGRPKGGNQSRRGWEYIDGGVVDSLSPKGWKEYVHNPSLVQHMGAASTLNSKGLPQASTFLGEDFDAMRFLREADTLEQTIKRIQSETC